MAAQRALPRIAIAQVPMHWTIDQNLAAMLAAMQLGHERGATLCAFSELALTGFHRQIASQALPELLLPAVGRIAAQAVKLRQAVAFGAPVFGANGERFNSHLLMDETGAVVASVHKNGLTAPEATFFQAGTGRSSARLQGLTTSAVICREVEDHDRVASQLREPAPQLLLWPGAMRPDPEKPFADPPSHVQQAQRLAATCGAWVVQTNWPNALNRPEEGEHAGQSACISPEGELLFRLPKAAYGVGVFTLGEREPEWHPQ